MASKFVVKVSGPGVEVEQTVAEEVAREVVVLALGGTSEGTVAKRERHVLRDGHRYEAVAGELR